MVKLEFWTQSGWFHLPPSLYGTVLYNSVLYSKKNVHSKIQNKIRRKMTQEIPSNT